MAITRHTDRRGRCGILRSFLLPAIFFAAIWSQAAQASEFTVGKLLVANPEMSDPRFAQTVIYMVTHDANGAMGLVINRPLAKGPLQDLLKGFGIESNEAKGEVIIHYGGPVSANAGFVLHSDDAMLDDSTPVNDGIAMTANAEIIEAMARGKGPRESLILFGYAGWAAGQLEGELKAGAWHIVPADKNIVFGKDANKKWHQAMDRRRISL